MVAQPMPVSPTGFQSGPFTVDDIFTMPEDGNRYEVLGSSLLVVPAPSPKHQYVADRLTRMLALLVPSGIHVVTAAAVRLPGGDGPIPDGIVTTANPITTPRGFDVGDVNTVIEVVSPGNAMVDRAYKRELYAEAGIPCYWRVEIEPWRGHDGPLPLIVTRLLTLDGWRSTEAAAGKTTVFPLAVGRGGTGLSSVIDVPIDPAALVA